MAGDFIAIGGAEEKGQQRPQTILRFVAERVRASGGVLVLVPTATRYVAEASMAYTRVFRELGVREIQVLDIAHRREVGRPSHRALLADAGLVFFTGGDQRRIARRLRDTAIHAALWELHHAGRTIAGTSAGAVALAETMHFSASAAPANDPSAVDTMPGLGLVPDMWIDTHFSRRQRHGRLLAVVAQAPWKIGLGLDEDTAAIMDRRVIRVLGSGSVHVVDGRARGGHDLRIRILRQGDSLDLSDSSA